MSVTYQLKHPIVRQLRVAGSAATTETIEEVEVRRLNGSDIRYMELNRGKPGASLELLAKVTGRDKSIIDLMDAEDITEISEIVAGFLPDSLKAGASSSGT